jgi:DNA-binding transcriptional regulator WhiA
MEKKKRVYPHRPYVSTAPLTNITEEQKIKVKELYLQGSSQMHIEKTLRITRKTIRSILKDAGIDRTKSEQWRIRWNSSLNDNAFDELTPEALYWIGFLYADGHVRKIGSEYSIEIEIELKDSDHLNKLSKFLGSKKEPKQYSDNSVTIRFYSKKIQEKLRELGLHHNKSYTAIPHELLKDSRDFWRGVVDGDGGLYDHRGRDYSASVQITLCGTLETIFGFIIFCSDKLGIKDKYPTHREKGAGLYSVSYYSTDAKKVMMLLYGDSTVHLDRKYKVYKDIIKC